MPRIYTIIWCYDYWVKQIIPICKNTYMTKYIYQDSIHQAKHLNVASNILFLWPFRAMGLYAARQLRDAFVRDIIDVSHKWTRTLSSHGTVWSCQVGMVASIIMQTAVTVHSLRVDSLLLHRQTCHFQVHFIEWKSRYFDLNFAATCSCVFNQ